MTSRPFSFPVSLTPMRSRPTVGGGGREVRGGGGAGLLVWKSPEGFSSLSLRQFQLEDSAVLAKGASSRDFRHGCCLWQLTLSSAVPGCLRQCARDLLQVGSGHC